MTRRRTASGVGRSVGSTLLVTTGAVLLGLALVALWAPDTLFNEDRFAGTAVVAVQREGGH